MVKLKLTAEERNVIITELAERMKDIVYMNAREKAEEALNDIVKEDLHPNDVIDISYNFRFIFNDVLQILGRVRRQNEKQTQRKTTIKIPKEVFENIMWNATRSACPTCKKIYDLIEEVEIDTSKLNEKLFPKDHLEYLIETYKGKRPAPIL
ncbi:MAG: hypothetical protein DRN91_07105 [Candidatus Alkanophagales archaeon]|nr:MAG: hypothetical protein DRN91_07105 [Candidatus Alkanophagales archaeon]